MDSTAQHWVFAYGSLMWNPGFAVVERVPARLDGYARRFCLRSVVHRGTAENPGLVLALDAEAGTHCQGLALRVADDDWPQVLAELRARELTTNAYREVLLPVALDDGRVVAALSYVTRPEHAQYAGGLALEAQARIIAQAVGGRGPNTEYLFNTASHLAEMGILDLDMDALDRQVRALIGDGQGGPKGA